MPYISRMEQIGEQRGEAKRLEPICYETLKSQGLPIGSGLVESACKWPIQQRFKGVGMRWNENGFPHLLHERLAWVNHRLDEFYPKRQAPPPTSRCAPDFLHSWAVVRTCAFTALIFLFSVVQGPIFYGLL